MMVILNLFLTFLKIGALTFGGGYAMIPILTDEVLAQGWLTESEIINFIAISESTPGPIAINMATFVGSNVGGVAFNTLFGKFIGAFFATLGVVMPSFIIILLIVSILNNLLKYKGVESFLKGVRPVVVGLIVAVGITIFLSVVLSFTTINSTVNFDYKSLVIFGLIALINFVYKKITKKKPSVILLIGISAVLGIIFYGFF